MAGSDTCFAGSCHCDCDRTGSCAVEEDEAEETGRREWVDKSFHELDSEEYLHEQFLKGVQFLYILFVVVVSMCSGIKKVWMCSLQSMHEYVQCLVL